MLRKITSQDALRILSEKGAFEALVSNDEETKPVSRGLCGVNLNSKQPFITNNGNFKHCWIYVYNEDQPEMTRDEFMHFYRTEELVNTLSADDCLEVFSGILKGNSDITYELLSGLISDYGAEGVDVIRVPREVEDEKSKYVPYSDREVPPLYCGDVLISKGVVTETFATGCIHVKIGELWVDNDYLFENYTYPDGTPIGKLKEQETEE